jgi:O-antigen/teichoic acid export membrane protein
LTSDTVEQTTAGEGGRSATDALIKGGLARTLGYVVATGATAAVLPFLFRYLGVEQTGKYVTVLSLVTILAGIVETGLTGFSLRQYSITPVAERDQLMRDLLTMRLLVVTVSTAGVLAFMFAAGYDRTLVAGAAYGAILVALENVGSTYNVWLTSELRLGALAVNNVARQLLASVLAFAGIVLGLPLIAFFILFIPGGLLQAIIAWAATRDAIPHLPSLNFRRCWPLIKASLPFTAAMALGFLYFRAPVIGLSIGGSELDTGYFGAAFRIAETLTLMASFLLTAVVPILTRAASDDPALHRHGVLRITQVALLAGGGLAALTASGAHLAINVLAGPSFDRSAAILVAIAPVLVFKFLNSAWSLSLVSTGQYRHILMGNLAAAAVAVVLSAVAIPAFGISGAVAALLLAEATLMVAYRLAQHDQPFPTRGAITVALATAVASWCVLLPVPAIAQPVAGGLLYTAIVLLAGAVPPELMTLLPTRRRG